MKKQKQNKKRKGCFKNLEKNVLVLGILVFVLVVALVFFVVQNFNLKKDIKNLNENINTLSVRAVNDFSLFVASKVENCEPVTLMADDKSITINNVECK